AVPRQRRGQRLRPARPADGLCPRHAHRYQHRRRARHGIYPEPQPELVAGRAGQLEQRHDGRHDADAHRQPAEQDHLDQRPDADGNSGNGLEERLYVQQDANWNVTAVLNTAGVVQERYVEDPYGQASTLAPDWSARGSSSFAWNYLHQGGRYDSTSGLYDFRSRAYSQALGRFVSQDPASFAGGDANLY